MTTGDPHELLRAFCDELARCGVRHAVTSPGSRNTPLLLALAAETRLRAWSHVDERSAGFFALGIAKATGVPAVLCCTSGTAAANHLPAVHEAREARVPLLVLTADRPAELRDTGAGQTIDQVGLFGRAAKWFVEAALPPAGAAADRWVRRLACRAVWTATDGRPGVVHLNVPLREPLVPEGPLPAEADAPAPRGGRPGGVPWLGRTPGPPAGAPLRLPGRRGVVVAGRTERRGAGAEVAAWAARAGWPLLADPLSGARRGPAAIAHYDALLRADPGSTPDCVLRTGDLPTSKPLRAWLAALDCPQVALDAETAGQDPDAVVGHVHPGPLSALDPGEPADPAWSEGWRDADAHAGRTIEATLGPGLSEPRVARELVARLPPGDVLVVASSMPVRDVESFAPVRDEPPRVLANRGANGIDGTTSTAYGVAATGVATTLLTGDVALLHDLGALVTHSRHGLSLRIVVLDNDGGGIFHFLPVARVGAVFEEHVVTPHGLDLARVAALFGLPYTRAESSEDLLAPGLVHVRTDREENLALHRAVGDAVAAPPVSDPSRGPAPS